MHIILFFTFDISLKNWLESGLLDREILIYKKLVEKGINVTFVTFGDESDKLLIPQTNINIIPVYTLMNYSRYKVVRILKSLTIPYRINNEIRQATILKTNQLLGSWVTLIAKFLYKKPVYIRTGYDPLIFAIKNRKSYFKRFLYYMLTYFSLLFCDAYSVSSTSDKEFLNKNYLFVNKEKIFLSPNWIISRESVKKIQERISNRVLTVGRLEKQKNYTKLISNFQKKELGLDIVGNGSQYQELKKLGGNVKFLGKLANEDLLNLYQEYKIFVLFSTFEGNPKVILEAMASGCVVVASDIQNNREIISHNINGYLIDENENLSEVIENLISNEKQLIEISKEALEGISVSNSLEKTLNREIEVISSFYDS
jgi:glycosyltransferase involved in cell wall biosynthesis